MSEGGWTSGREEGRDEDRGGGSCSKLGIEFLWPLSKPSASLLGRLEALGPGVAAARGRRREAIDLDKRYRRATRAAILSERQGWNIHRAVFVKLD